MRNPRRHYGGDGTMTPPATVGGERAQGYSRAEIWCVNCNHHGEVDIGGLPADLPIPDICLRYRCSRCGSKNLMSRMSVCEHHDRVHARRQNEP